MNPNRIAFMFALAFILAACEFDFTADPLGGYDEDECEVYTGYDAELCDKPLMVCIDSSNEGSVWDAGDTVGWVGGPTMNCAELPPRPCPNEAEYMVRTYCVDGPDDWGDYEERDTSSSDTGA